MRCKACGGARPAGWSGLCGLCEPAIEADMRHVEARNALLDLQEDYPSAAIRAALTELEARQ